MAEPLAATYGVSLAAIGLLTTALFITHLAVQLPAGIGSDRLGARTVALAACVAAAAGNALLLVSDDYGLAVAGRLVAGLGSGAGFVAGLDLVRAGGGGPVLNGVYGGSTMAGGGAALMILPALTDATGWRAPFWTGLLLAVAAAALVLPAHGLPRVARRRQGVLRERRLLPLGALQAATFGLAVVAGNWVVTLLERSGTSSAVAGVAGGTVLLAGIVTRPLGGVLSRRPERGRAIVAVGVAVGAAATLVLALAGPLWLSALAAVGLGLAAGLPFAAVFDAARRLRPDAPASASALVNACGVLTILVGTPLAGLAFAGSRSGAAAFAALGVLALAALPCLRWYPH